MVVINTIIILGGTYAEHIPVIKSKPVAVPEQEVFPDIMFFANFLYQ